jgi:hypothetical protein
VKNQQISWAAVNCINDSLPDISVLFFTVDPVGKFPAGLKYSCGFCKCFDLSFAEETSSHVVAALW